MTLKKIYFSLFFLFISLSIFGQISIDSIQKSKELNDFPINGVDENSILKFNYKQLIIPTVLISYGLIGLQSTEIKSFNENIRNQVVQDNHSAIRIDDITQFAPEAAVIGLDLLGVKGKHSLKDKAIILATANIIMGATVYGLKNGTHQERPDGSAFNSFPSGHTANAFMGAEMLNQEYKDTSVWYGISGYVIASGTGVLRMYNNRHWFTDVVTGAGIGILSTKAAYWLYPTISKLFTKKEKASDRKAFIPYYNGKEVGFGFVSRF